MAETAPARRDHPRLAVAGIWLGSLLACCALGLLLLWEERISMDGFRALLVQVSQTYAVYVGAVVAFVYAQRLAPALRAPGSRLGFAVAAAVSLAFNAVVVGAVAAVAGGAAKLQEALALVSFISPLFVWLVAPVIGYYFARPDLAEQR